MYFRSFSRLSHNINSEYIKYVKDVGFFMKINAIDLVLASIKYVEIERFPTITINCAVITRFHGIFANTSCIADIHVT